MIIKSINSTSISNSLVVIKITIERTKIRYMTLKHNVKRIYIFRRLLFSFKIKHNSLLLYLDTLNSRTMLFIENVAIKKGNIKNKRLIEIKESCKIRKVMTPIKKIDVVSSDLIDIILGDLKK